MSNYHPDSLSTLLPIYYKRLFPHGPFFRWLSYGNVDTRCFANREFSFTLEHDIYLRYQSFSNQEEFEKEIAKICPHKIDIGAVYSCRPKYRNQYVFQVIEKELVFDIDMTDYDDVRTCCSGADVCTKCWKFMVIACKIIDAALREDFGFQHILWVFSGRRGVHCWVCDESARKLNNLARPAIAEYLQVLSGGENQAKKVTLISPIHPSIQRALNFIEPLFDEVCIKDQDILGTDDRIRKFTALIPDDEFRNSVGTAMLSLRSSKERWQKFLQMYQSTSQKRNCKCLVEEIKLQYTYPRLDIHVTKGMNHLLKSPFCVHPKTGKICVPFNPKAVDKFDPTTVPTISTLIEEVGEYDDKQKKILGDADKARVKDYKKTSVYKNVNVFEEFVRNLEAIWKGKNVKIGISDQSMEF
ncbi:unnamed protein product [Bemisia tabaci]|uniref:DNA primase n=1 Tax=Bemisia tabaci TaxID=7038 RepID=A0A9N9ZX35_BEMTA|nr:PREDICTED: DNA primase small subunit isoform X2 [Bemisia tabaci]CAH0380999.1 unnamed protein product [Bemisia tabaci]